MKRNYVLASCIALGLFAAVVQGCAGEDGEKGPAGAVGPTGPAGSNGSPGATGVTGPAGATGPAGTSGATGATGATGDVGATGAVGPVGPSLGVEAAMGMAIAPVALNLDGLDSKQLEMVGWGSYIVNARVGCGDCHDMQGPNGPAHLGGGSPFDLPGETIVYARNLTPDSGGLPAGLTEDQFVEALRTGKDFEAGGNEQLVVMPWEVFRYMSTHDLKAIYAYLKAVPAVTNIVMPAVHAAPFANPPGAVPTAFTDGDSVNPLPPEMAGPPGMESEVPDPGNYLRGLAVQPLNSAQVPNTLQGAGLDEQALYALGSYIVNTQSGCSDCHTNPPRLPVMEGDASKRKINTAGYLAGGQVFEVGTFGPGLDKLTGQTRTMSENLTPHNLTGFNQPFATFLQIMTTGTHAEMGANATPLGFPMPWMHYRNMSLRDLQGVYTYIRNVTAVNKKTQTYARYCEADGDCKTGETCATASKECVGSTCAANTDCDACQTCTSTKCAAPTDMAACAMGLLRKLAAADDRKSPLATARGLSFVHGG
jgi:hypothetical protein